MVHQEQDHRASDLLVRIYLEQIKSENPIRQKKLKMNNLPEQCIREAQSRSNVAMMNLAPATSD